MRRVFVPLLLTAVAVLGRAGAAGAPSASAVSDDFVAPAPAKPLAGAGAAGLAAIRERALAAHIAFLSSAALEGRGLAGRGLDVAAEYVASTLALAGVPPMTGTAASPERSAYFQQVPLREISGTGGEVIVERRAGGRTRSRVFHTPADCLLPEIAPQSLVAPVVFAGYGIRERGLGRDDYLGLDVRKKAVLVCGGLSSGPEWQAPEMRSRYGAERPTERWAARAKAAPELGAAAILVIDEGLGAKRTPERPAERFFLPFDAHAHDDAPLVRVSPSAADALLATIGENASSARGGVPRDLPGATVTIRVTGSERVVKSRNVVGMLSGSDPALREETIIIGAHLDHLGKAGDVVYPGADDNASGVAALIEIAKTFAALPDRPRRTVVFAFWTGEEEGKLGSGYWIRHPLWPLKRTAAYLNLDMIGHPWSKGEIAKLVEESGLPKGREFVQRVTPELFAEPGFPQDAPEIAAALRRAASTTGMALHFDRTDGTTGGSDYRDFARAHVPFVRFFGNFFPAYHEPGDTPEALGAGQVERMARLAFATAWLLADHQPL